MWDFLLVLPRPCGNGMTILDARASCLGFNVNVSLLIIRHCGLICCITTLQPLITLTQTMYILATCAMVSRYISWSLVDG